MLKVIMLCGLQASGKSTYAKQLIDKYPGQYKRVNKDSLREMLDNSKWSKDNENFVIRLRDDIILAGLKAGKNIIVDDTNLASKHEVHIRSLVDGIAEFQIDEFDLSLEECIERDLKRSNPVGEKVIRETYNKFLKPKIIKPVYDFSLSDVILCDIDGTLSLFDREKKNAYDRDFENDELNQAVYNVIKNYNVILVSGREEKHREKTIDFLLKHNVQYLQMFMRATGDKRKDVVVKKEIYEHEILGKYNVLWVFDDRNQTVQGWRDLGLTCFQVADGNF